MPELPEVQTVVNFLTKLIVGKTILSINSPNKYTRVFSNSTITECNRFLLKKRITKITRRGKYIIFALEEGYLCIHLRMTGKLLLNLEIESDMKYVSAQFEFTDGTQLFFKDVRKFGRIYYSENLDWLESKLGIEPLSEKFTSKYLYQHLQQKNRQMKPLLLDQSFIAGLGNIYVDEVLWYAGIHPLMIASQISEKQSKKLYEGIQSILLNAIAVKGTTIINFSYGENGRGNYKDQLNVFGETNNPCPKCKTIIQKIFVGQRGTHFCPACQPN